jgi:hypothetical protein
MSDFHNMILQIAALTFCNNYELSPAPFKEHLIHNDISPSDYRIEGLPILKAEIMKKSLNQLEHHLMTKMGMDIQPLNRRLAVIFLRNCKTNLSPEMRDTLMDLVRHTFSLDKEVDLKRSQLLALYKEIKAHCNERLESIYRTMRKARSLDIKEVWSE